MKERLTNGITMGSTHIATIQLLGINRLARQIHFLPKIKTAPIISLGVLCDDGCTITLDKQAISIHNNGEYIIKGTRNKKKRMWEVPLEPQQSENLVNNVQAQTSKPWIAKYLHAALFSPATVSLRKEIKYSFLNTWPGFLTGKLIKKHLDKSRNTTMVLLNMRRQGLQSTREKPPYTDLEENTTTNILYCTTVKPSTIKEGKI